MFSLVNNNEVVGISALFHEGSGVFELGRMAVSPGLEGNGYGGVLMETCLEKLREIEASKVYLLFNTKLDVAITLYKKYGFETTYFGEHAICARANIVMERNDL
ncbi:MAG: GNAT family N-acetyltransferase [Arenicellaceae bacterium]|nr:GNAT family N-acetyltransferase [Arenicellaceae bacterium]